MKKGKRPPTVFGLSTKDSPATLSDWRNSLPPFAQLALISMRLREISMDCHLRNVDFFSPSGPTPSPKPQT